MAKIRRTNGWQQPQNPKPLGWLPIIIVLLVAGAMYMLFLKPTGADADAERGVDQLGRPINDGYTPRKH